jgi:hypothetical protein
MEAAHGTPRDDPVNRTVFTWCWQAKNVLLSKLLDLQHMTAAM